MAVIIANPTGIFQATFKGVEPTKSPDWIKVNVQLQTDIEIPVKETLLVSVDNKDLFNSIKTLEIGKVYKFFLGVSMQNARVEPSTGKTYLARTQYKFLKVL